MRNTKEPMRETKRYERTLKRTKEKI